MTTQEEFVSSPISYSISQILKSLKRDSEKPLVVNDVWYLLSCKWLEMWKQIVNSHHEGGSDNHSNHSPLIPAIDNSDLIDNTIQLTYTYIQMSVDTTAVPTLNGTVANGSSEQQQQQQKRLPLLEEKPSSCSYVYSVALKPNLQESVDFVPVSLETWQLFIRTYGMKGDVEKHTIERRVISDGLVTSVKRLEIYPYLLQLFRIDSKTNLPDPAFETVLVSKKTTLQDLRRIGYRALHLYLTESKKVRMAAQQDLDSVLQRNVRIWNYLTSDATLVSNTKMNMSLEEALIVTDQRILFEVPINEVWPLDRLHQQQKQQSRETAAEEQEPSVGSDEDTDTSSLKKKRRFGLKLKFLDDVKAKILDRHSPRNGSSNQNNGNLSANKKRGVCGLRNLGNTCFMNSALQCLSNTEPLNEFFLSGSYIQDINKTNPLGSKGKLAKEFAHLMKEMWSGSTCVAPINFKYAIGQFAPQFSGFAQHDSQELIAYLLDGLHEDLNRVKKKEMVELKEANGRPDELVAEEAWGHHLLRNRSVIVDLFHGQLKSTLKCPDCERISIKFDPFMYLSVPIPHTSTVVINIIMIEDLAVRPQKYCMEISLNHTIGVLTQKFADEFNFDSRRIIFADMIGFRVNSVLDHSTPMNLIAQKKQILCFNLPAERNFVTMRVSQRFIVPQDNTKKPCGIPLMLFLDREVTTRRLYEIVWKHIQRYVSSQYKQSGEALLGELPFDPKSKCFSLCLLNDRSESCGNENCRNTQCDGCILEISDDPFVVSPLKTIMIQWYSDSYFDSKEAMTVNLDPSVSSCRERMNRQITLEDCLTTFSEMEQLGPNDPWYCPNCRELKQAYKKFEIWSAPDILCIHLKRFVYDRRYRERIDKLVDFPIERMDMSRFMVRNSTEPVLYDLYAISNHIGSLGGGHYIAHAKNKLDGNWYCFNDSSCSLVSEASLKSSSAYLLFYRRRRLSANNGEDIVAVNLEQSSNNSNAQQ